MERGIRASLRAIPDDYENEAASDEESSCEEFAGDAKGVNLGLTMATSRVPYIASMPSQACDIVKAYKEIMDATKPGFYFTSLQLVVNNRAQLHVDANNVGPSRGLVIGPMSGGQLCYHDEAH